MASMEVKVSAIHSSLASDPHGAMFWKSSEDSNHGKNVDFREAQKDDEEDQVVTTHQHPGNSYLFSSYNAETNQYSDSRPELRQLMKRLNKMYRFCNYVGTTVVLALVAVNIAAGVMVRKDADSIVAGTSLADLSTREIALIQMGISARVYSYNISPRVNQLVLGNFEWFRGLVEASKQRVWDEIDQAQSVEYREFMTQELVGTWELVDDSAVLVRRTLIDAIQFILDNANAIAGSTSSASVAANVYNVYRNSLGETYHAAVTAQEKFAKCQKAVISSLISNYYLYLVCAVAVVLAGASVLLPAQLLMQRTSGVISRCVLMHPLEVFIRQKTKALERLKRYDIELETSIEDPFRGGRKRFRLYNPLLLMGTTVGGLLLSCLIFYIVLYFRAFVPLAETMEMIPVLMNLEAKRYVALSEAYISLEEKMVEGTNRSRSNYIREASIFLSPDDSFGAAASAMGQSSRELMDYVVNGFPMSKTHFDDTYDSETDSSSSYLAYGRRAGLKQLLIDLEYCMVVNTRESQALMHSVLYPLQIELANSSTAHIQMFADDAAAAADFKIHLIISLLVAFSAGSLVYLFAGIMYMNRETYMRAKVFWKLCSMLPLEDLHYRKASGLKEEERGRG